MCFMIKRYETCAVFGHCIKEYPAYDRETCEKAKTAGDYGSCKEIQMKYAPEFVYPFCSTCSSMEAWLFNRAKASMVVNRAAGRCEKPIFTETFLDQLRGKIDAPGQAPLVDIGSLTSFMETVALAETEEMQAERAASCINRQVGLASQTVSMEGLTEQFASWVAAVYRLRLVKEATELARREQDEHRTKLLEMLAVESEAVCCYKARLEYLGVWKLFLSLAGIGPKLDEDSDPKKIAYRCLR
ncbi:hypothetical protein PG989_015237 [Apiospora arundinis]